MNRAEFDPERERAFVDAFLADDHQSRERFAERLSCVPRMLAARNRRLGGVLHDDELRDLAQDTFVVILRQLPSYRPLAPLESWFYGICCRQIQAARRGKVNANKLRQPFPDSDPPSNCGAVAALLEDAAEAHELLAEMGGLEAEVVRMKHLEGLTFAVLGARLDLSPNTVKTVYYRGLSKLRQRMQGDSPRVDQESSA